MSVPVFICSLKAIVNEFVREVAQHSIAEELLIYPIIENKNLLGEGERIADHLRQDHYEVKELLFNLDKKRVNDPGFDELFDKTIAALKGSPTHACEMAISPLFTS